ncbi:MAG: helix-turn-helix transcriptional regulator [Alistipes sp.]
MSEENYFWYLKAMQMTISAMIAIGIFARWNVAAKARKPLAFMFLFMTIFYLIDFVLSIHHQCHPFLLRQGAGLAYSFGALYNGILLVTMSYVYAHALFRPQKLSWRTLLSYNVLVLCSFGTYVILSIMGYKPQPGYGFAELWANLWSNPFVLLWLATMVWFYGYVIYVCVTSLRWMLIHQRNIRNNFSLVGGFRYYYIYIICALFFSMVLLGVFTLWFKTDGILNILPGVLFIVIIVLIYIFSYLQPDVYSEKHPMKDVEGDDEVGTKDECQFIKVNDRRLLDRLMMLIEQERIYKQPDLSAEMLAEHMGVSRKKLYLFLKEYKNTTFSDYINGCRIEYAARMMSSGEYVNMSTVEISELSGFNSLGTFNNFFKAKYGTTPAKYRSGLVVDDHGVDAPK